MKKISLSIFVVLLSYSFVFSEDYDLIVNPANDSIACHVDSIRDAHIYFIMKFNSKWIQKNYNNKDVFNYQYDIIKRKNTYLKSGLSFIDPFNQLLQKEKLSLSLFLGFSFLGPKSEIEYAMKSVGLDDYGSMGFFSSSTTHPNSIRYPVFDFEARYHFSNKSGISLNIGLADGIEVDGLGFLFIDNHGENKYTLELKSKIWLISLNYVYSSIDKRHCLFFGPSFLNHNVKGEKVDEVIPVENKEKLGLYLGYSLRIIQKKKWFLKLKTSYSWVPKTEIGPYIYYNDTYEPLTLTLFPETELNLSSLAIGLSVGLKIN